MKTEVRLQSNKERILAVDIVRILAALAVMFYHIPIMNGGGAVGSAMGPFFKYSIGHPSTIFLVLAGYFACRNITWKKAWNNAVWCILPFVLWNIIIIGVRLCYAPEDVTAITWPEWFGFGRIGIGNHMFGPGKSIPVGGSLWFMRDLALLFLLSPILARHAKWLFPLLLFPAVFSNTERLFEHDCFTTLSLYSLISFLFGCFLRKLPDEVQGKMLRFYSPRWLVIFYTVALLATVDAGLHLTGMHSKWGIRWYFIPSLLALVNMYWVARWIEEKVAWAKPYALTLAPVTFLTFAAHGEIYRLVRAFFPSFFQSELVLILPIAVFGVMTLFFFALKKWFPAALHLVAHYKLRLEDVQKNAGAARG